jgi:hypothetical protein
VACAKAEPDGAGPRSPDTEQGAWVMYTDGRCGYIPHDEWAQEQEEADKRARRDAGRYERHCERGKAAACSLLASQYEEGRGVPKDPARAGALERRAFAIDTKACDAGDARACEKPDFDACRAAGLMWLGGEGVPADEARGGVLLERATALAKAACAAGRTDACDYLEQIAP